MDDDEKGGFVMRREKRATTVEKRVRECENRVD